MRLTTSPDGQSPSWRRFGKLGLYLGSNIHGYFYHPNSRNNSLPKPVCLAPSAFSPQIFIKHLLYWSSGCSIAQNIKKKYFANGNLQGSIRLELCYFIYVKMIFMKYKEVKWVVNVIWWWVLWIKWSRGGGRGRKGQDGGDQGRLCWEDGV